MIKAYPYSLNPLYSW